jgi:hypothetical protein
MGAIVTSTIGSQTSEDEARHRIEAELILIAIASAIVSDTLPPDDAYAWARIAVHEARHLRTVAEATD